VSAVLVAAVADTLAEHPWDGTAADGDCECGWEATTRGFEAARFAHAAHQAERAVARLAVLLPGLPADQLAALIGGTVNRDWLPPKRYPDQGRAGTNDMWLAMRVVTPWVPDSPSAVEGGE
jgi:hypothetical protein